MDVRARAPRILVVGGSGRLGRVICGQLAERGAVVAATYHTGRAVVDGLCARWSSLSGHPLDVSQPEQIETAVARVRAQMGGIDAVIYCAAIAGVSAHAADRWPGITELPIDDWDRVMAVNVRGAFLVVRAAHPALVEQGGNVVLVGSIDSAKPIPSPAHYAASKSAMVGLVRALAKELGPQRVQVNLVAPGLLEIGLSEVVPPPLVAQYLKHSALQRRGKPAEVAATVCWLACENSYVTGQVISVDGGL